MKKILCFVKLPIAIFVLLFLIINFSSATNIVPDVSIVTDKAPGVSVIHGLTKLTDALQAKNITFEKIGSINEAKGKIVIVTGLAFEDGTASKILKAGGPILPRVPESLTI